MGDSDLGEDTFLVRTFISSLKASGLAQQLRGAQEAMMRSLVRRMDHTSIYDLIHQQSISESPKREEEQEGLGMMDYVSASSATPSSIDYIASSPRNSTNEQHLILEEDEEGEKDEYGGEEVVTETMKEALNNQFM